MTVTAQPLTSPRSSAPAPAEPFSLLRPDGTLHGDVEPPLPMERIVELYRAMVRTRIVDEQLVKLQRQGRIGFHIGSLGEEAAILGSAAAMREQDWIFPCYREFGALLWRGMPLQTYLDNMYGNEGDAARGRQMPDHYTGRPYRFGSVSSPIGTQMPQAVGFAWAAKKKGEDVVTSVYLGEGASSSNDFHVAMNFAGVFRTPTVFLLRNNRWAISVPAERQTASSSFAIKAVAYGMTGVQCDGNDLLATYVTVREAVERAARGEGPTLVELLTYRLGGHSTSDDPRAYRPESEVERWRATDPIVRLRRFLETQGAWDEAREEAWRQEVEAELKEAIATAEKKGPPPLESMFEDVYAEQPWHLREQRRELLEGPRAPKHH